MWDDRGLKCSWVPINIIFYSSRPWNNDNYVKNCNLTMFIVCQLVCWDMIGCWSGCPQSHASLASRRIKWYSKRRAIFTFIITMVFGRWAACKANVASLERAISWYFQYLIVVIPGYCGISLLPMVYPHFYKSRCYNHNFLYKITCDEKLFLVINCTASLTGKCMIWKIIQDDTQ